MTPSRESLLAPDYLRRIMRFEAMPENAAGVSTDDRDDTIPDPTMPGPEPGNANRDLEH